MAETDDSDNDEDRKMPAKDTTTNVSLKPPPKKRRRTKRQQTTSSRPASSAALSDPSESADPRPAPAASPAAANRESTVATAKTRSSKANLPTRTKRSRTQAPQQQALYEDLPIIGSQASVKYAVRSSFAPQVVARAAGTESHGRSDTQERAEQGSDATPENETPDQKRLRKNRRNERRKRARRAMKIDYLTEQHHNITAENERLKNENELLRQRIETTRSASSRASSGTEANPNESALNESTRIQQPVSGVSRLLAASMRADVMEDEEVNQLTVNAVSSFLNAIGADVQCPSTAVASRSAPEASLPGALAVTNIINQTTNNQQQDNLSQLDISSLIALAALSRLDALQEPSSENPTFPQDQQSAAESLLQEIFSGAIDDVVLLSRSFQTEQGNDDDSDKVEHSEKEASPSRDTKHDTRP